MAARNHSAQKGNNMTTYRYKNEDATLHVSRYADDGSVALVLTDRYKSVITSLSVNLSTHFPDFGTFCVDTNNCPTAEQFLIENNIAVPTGRIISSGYCKYPVYRLNEEILRNAQLDEEI